MHMVNWDMKSKIEDSYSRLQYDLTQVGVGVSQVLPILAMGLISNPDDFRESDPKIALRGGYEMTLVFEQPELHLHPKVQSLLGDFFLSLALCGRQCIIETHSEYLINRLRYRLAGASPESDIDQMIKIHFFEKESGESKVREVEVNEYGAIVNWPEGFFDQSVHQAEENIACRDRKAHGSVKIK